MRIITTVGTSIFTNYNKKEEVVRKYPSLSRDYEGITIQYSNLDKRVNEKGKEESIPASDYTNSRYQSDIDYIREVIQYLWLAEAQEKSCAELQTLYKIIEEEQNVEAFEVYLLATDTVLSVLACELIKEFLLEKRTINGKAISCVFNDDIKSADTTVVSGLNKEEVENKEYTIVSGLQVNSADNFTNDGFNNLLEIIDKATIEKNTLLNISGGYKGIIPFLTLFAQIKNITLKYNYEDSDTLISVGSLPFHFDYSLFEDEFLAFEAIKPGKKVDNLPNEEAFLKLLGYKDNFKLLQEKQLIQVVKNKVRLSLLGEMLYRKYEEIDKEDGFDVSNLLGFTMEALIFKFLNDKFPSNKNLLGKNIGQSQQGDAYDIDVFIEKDETIWAIEVKPQNVKVLINSSDSQKRQMKTLEYKCSNGAFKNAYDEYGDKVNIAIFMYHHLQPNEYQRNNFIELHKKYNYIKWIWLKPPNNYKGNINWSIIEQRLKEFDFENQQWKKFEF
jgi:CRISPR/Cas system-associated protein Csm6